MQVLLNRLSELLTRFEPVIQVSVFLGFFTFTAAVFYYVSRTEEANRRRARRLFIVAVIIGFVVSTNVGVISPPFGSYRYFSTPAERTQTQYHVKLVDGDGDELRYPSDAAPPGRVGTQAARMLQTYSERERVRTAAFLLRSAREHRRAIADGISPVEWIRYRTSRFLPKLGTPVWTPERLENYGRIEGIRVYRVEIRTADDGLSIERVNRTLVYEYYD